METLLIEQLDKSRYNLQKWGTIGFGIWFASIILNNFMDNVLINLFAALLAVVGTPFYAINQIKLAKLERKLKSNKKLQEALNNELYILNGYKSTRISLLVSMGTTAVLLVISNFFEISALLVTELILYFGIMAALISILYYNRES